MPGGWTQYVKTLEVTNVNGWNCNISWTNPNWSFYSDSSFKFLSPNGTWDQVDLICYNSTNAYLTEPGINITSTSSINTKWYECY